MAKSIFVNLPVQDLERSKAFFQKLGFNFNPQFSNDKGLCIVISETIFAMLLTHEFFTSFTAGKQISDSGKTTEAIIALSADSREQVDKMADAAIAAGGSKHRDADDHGFMYARSFQDPDGHIWEVVWMDPSTIQK